MTAPATVTFYVTPGARELIERLADGSGKNMSQVALSALEYYRGLLDEGGAEKPDAARIVPGTAARRLTIPGETDIAGWAVQSSDAWGVSRGQVLTSAVESYAGAIESGRVPAPKTGTRATTPKKQTAPSLTRPVARPTLNDRARCGVCGKQVNMDAGTELLADHIAHPSVRPKGVYQLCEGSGQQPAGPVIHSAETDWRRI